MFTTTTSEITHFFTKVAGVTHKNEDGSSRQEIIQNCSPCEQVFFRAEPNYYAPNAVAVLRENGTQLGYVPAEIAEDFRRYMAYGWEHVGFIWAIVGGGMFPTLGLRLVVVRANPAATEEEIQQYIDYL